MNLALSARDARITAVARNANYGVSDVFCNFAAECAHDTALHFMAGDVLYPELINPDSSAPIAIATGARGNWC